LFLFLIRKVIWVSMNSISALSHKAANVLHAVSIPSATWSSINLAEAVPGVMTPLCASVWVPASELGLRQPFLAMDALPARLAGIPADLDDRITNAFYRRMAVRVDFLCEMGDLIPGQSGEALSRDFFGFFPESFHSRPSARRLPFILVRYPRTIATIGRRIKRLRVETDAWWRAETGRVADLELSEAQRVAATARNRFLDSLAAQAVISATVIQPVQEQLAAVCTRADVDAAVLLRGSSHEEGTVLDDLWDVSRGVLAVEQFVKRHGHHGPGEGELESHVWREDLAAVHALLGVADVPELRPCCRHRRLHEPRGGRRARIEHSMRDEHRRRYQRAQDWRRHQSRRRRRDGRTSREIPSIDHH
jgi:pyruvate, water dikinase